MPDKSVDEPFMIHIPGTKVFFYTCLLVTLFAFIVQGGTAQEIPGDRGSLRIMLYNVENLFDIFDDPFTLDDEFLPSGERAWNKYRYSAKLNNICKVIVALGGWNPPEIIGLCEVENRKVILDLVRDTPLKKFNYEIIHKDSPDERGIDVALIYLTGSFNPLNIIYIKLEYPGDPTWNTRDILYVEGVTAANDTLHLFVNHWPSRSTGQLETEKYRIYAASVLSGEVKKIFTGNSNANVIIMGDFNDEPEDKSIKTVLGAQTNLMGIEKHKLYNLSFSTEGKRGKESYKYRMTWATLDQFIVSGNLLNEKNRIYTHPDFACVFAPSFLLEQDPVNLGMKPFRTYSGFRYRNGFSDHLPIFLDLKRNE